MQLKVKLRLYKHYSLIVQVVQIALDLSVRVEFIGNTLSIRLKGSLQKNTLSSNHCLYRQDIDIILLDLRTFLPPRSLWTIDTLVFGLMKGGLSGFQ